MRSLRVFRSLLERLYVAPLREAIIQLDNLPPDMRILGWGGYIGLAFLLMVMILSSFLGGNQSFVLLPTVLDGHVIHVYVPVLVLATGLLGLFLGWAYILTAITARHPALFLPFATIFCVQQICLISVNSGWVMVLLCLVLLFTWAIMIAYLLTHKKAFWRDRPLVELGLWLFVFLLFALVLWWGRGSFFELATGLDIGFRLLFLAFIPLWLLLGLSLVEFALDMASRIVAVLQHWLPAEGIKILTGFTLLAPPLALLLRYLWERFAPMGKAMFSLLTSGIALHAFFSAPLLLVLIGAVMRRRWDGRCATRLLSLNLVMLVFAMGLALALDGIDLSSPLEWTVQSANILPSALVFVIMLVYNIFDTGAKFSRGDSRFLPRQTRVLLIFGMALLITGMVMFMTNLRDESGYVVGQWESGFDNFFALGLMLLGLPYLLWVIWKRGYRLAGAPVDAGVTEPRLASLAVFINRRPSLTIILFVLAVLIFASLLACLIPS